MNYIAEYIKAIKSGKIVVGNAIRRLYVGILEPIINDEDPAYYFDEDEGELPIRFMEGFCKHPRTKEWYNKPLKLMLFQKAKYQAIFGIRNRKNGLRRFTEVFDVRGRKNGKSTEMAALGLYLTLFEPGAEVYVAATVYAQAKRVWDDAKAMIGQNRDLQRRFKHKTFPSCMIYTTKNSSFNVLSKNVKTFDGLNASAALVDEVHELQREIYDILKQSMTTRKSPLMLMITTAGFVREGLFDDTYNYAKKVLDGVVDDPTLLPIIYELDSPEELDDEKCWVKANPGIDEIKDREQLRANVNKAKADPNFAGTVKTKDFNIIGVERRAWLSYADFHVPTKYDKESLRKFNNTFVLGAFDLSRTRDITAYTTLLFDKERGRIVIDTMYWVTAAFLESEDAKRSKVPWKQWIDRGLVRISGANVIDYHDVSNYVAANFQVYGWMYLQILYDSYSADFLVQELESQGYSRDDCLVPVHQGAKTLSVPMQILESHLKEKVADYLENPVTTWCLSNVEVEEDRNGNYMPRKNRNSSERKIDGFATILNAYVGLCKDIDYYMK